MRSREAAKRDLVIARATRDVVEVIARFGDTVLDVRHIDRDGQFRIGTGPDVDLPMPGHTSFPLVDRAKIRVPIGVVPYDYGGTTVIHLGSVSVSLTRRKLAVAPLAHRRIDWRAPAFVLGSLALHVFIYLLAVTLEPFERITEKQLPRMRYAHVADMTPPPPAVEPKRDPKQPEPTAASAASVRPRVERAEPEDAMRSMGRSTAKAVAAVAKSFDDTKVYERVSALKEEDNFTEDDTYTSGFGGRLRFPPGETVKTREYGEIFAYLSFDVKLCPAKSCTFDGPVPPAAVRSLVQTVVPALYDCYAQHAERPGTIVLSFTIAGDGSVKRSRGSGLGETGACAARVVEGLYFKAIGDNDVAEGKQKETYVRYPVKFDSTREL